MTHTLQAVFDGTGLRPEEPLRIEPNTLVQITVEVPEVSTTQPYSFLRKARSLGLEGPADWSEKLDEHLYGDSSGSDVPR